MTWRTPGDFRPTRPMSLSLNVVTSTGPDFEGVISPWNRWMLSSESGA